MTTEPRAPAFSSAPDGWRVAFKWPDVQEIIVVPVVGWQTRAEEAPRPYIGHLEVEPVVLFDNVSDPLIVTVADTLRDWTDGETLHQIIAPGFAVREVPDGWKVREYPD